MKKINYLKIFIFVLFLLPTLYSAQAISTCFNTTINTTVCANTDSGFYPQNIDLWEGENEKYGLFISNPDDDLNYNIFVRQLTNAFDSGKIDVTKLGDDTTFEFRSINDFYNVVQQKNAIGNVTLFTKAELNQETREQNILLTTEVLNWTVTLLVVVMELFKMVFSLLILVLAVFVFFRLIPIGLKLIVKIIFKIAIGK